MHILYDQRHLLTILVNNVINIFFNRPKHCFISILVNIKNVFFLIELWSSEKSCTVSFKEISLCSSLNKQHFVDSPTFYAVYLKKT